MRGYERQKCDKALWEAAKTKPRVELRGAMSKELVPRVGLEPTRLFTGGF